MDIIHGVYSWVLYMDINMYKSKILHVNNSFGTKDQHPAKGGLMCSSRNFGSKLAKCFTPQAGKNEVNENL